MASEWYVQHGGKQYGPLASADLKKLASQRKITPSTNVRLGTSGNWVPAARVQGLFAAPAGAPKAAAGPNAPPASKPPAAKKPSPASPKPSDIDLPPLAAQEMADMDLPPPAAPPAPPPMATPVARVPVASVAPMAKADTPEGSMAAKILGAVGLVFGIVALATFWLPLLGGGVAWTGIVVGALGLILGASGMIVSAMQKGSGLYLNVAGTSSAAVGLVLTVVLGISFGMFTSTPEPTKIVVHRPAPPPTVETPAPTVEPPKEPEPEPEPEPEIVWTDANLPIEQGPVRATIASVGVEKIRLESSDLSTMKRGPLKPMLKVRVTIENTTADKMVEAPGWNGSAGLLGGSGLEGDLAGAVGGLLKDSETGKAVQAATAGATLVDNVGNNYKQTPAIQIFGAQSTFGEDAVILPGKSATKELVFSPPLEAETIEYLRLELSPAGFSGSEPLRFQIPVAMIAGR